MDEALPNSEEAEIALLGAILLDSEVVYEVQASVKPTDFFWPEHRTVYEVCLALAAGKRPIDHFTLVSELRDRKRLESVGGVAGLRRYTEVLATMSAVRHYSRMVLEKSQLRQLHIAGHHMQKLALDANYAVADALAESQQLLARVLDAGSVEDHKPPAERLFAAYQRALEPQTLGLLTPWPLFNTMLGGVFGGQLLIWAGAPKMGKSAAALQLADFFSRHYGQVAYFALEMDEPEITERQLAIHSGVAVRRQRAGNLSLEERDALYDAVEICRGLPLEVFSHRVNTIDLMRKELRKMARRAPVVAFFVDHVGKLREVQTPTKLLPSKHERLDVAYNALIELARDFNASAHAIQHITRAGVDSGARPSLAQIRDGGNPEGHANVVTFVHRPDPSNLRGEGKLGELFVAACRQGEPGVVNTEFDGARGIWMPV